MKLALPTMMRTVGRRFVLASDISVVLAPLFAEDTVETLDFACRIFVLICNCTCIHPKRAFA